MDPRFEETLLKVDLFGTIDIEALRDMLTCLKPKTQCYDKNEVIAIAGEPFKGVGIVLTGEVLITKDNAAGNRVVMAKLGPGNIFGEMIAFTPVRKWPATVQALEESCIMFLEPDTIVGTCERGCSSHRQLVYNMLKIVSQKALVLNRKVEYLAIKGMREKIATYLLEQYHNCGKMTFMVPLNRNELADFLNVSRPSMSREISRMKDEGLIDFYKSSFKIINLVLLKECIE